MMKCLNLYAVFGHASNAQGGKALQHYPVFADENGAQYIYLRGGYMLLSDAKNIRKDFIRTEAADLGN